MLLLMSCDVHWFGLVRLVKSRLLTLALLELLDFVLVVRVVGIPDIQEIELGIAQFVGTNSGFEFGAIAGDEASCLVDDV